MKYLTFILYKDKSDPDYEWRWRLMSLNNKIIAVSGEGYKNKGDCKKAIKLVIDAATSGKFGKGVVREVHDKPEQYWDEKGIKRIS